MDNSKVNNALDEFISDDIDVKNNKVVQKVVKSDFTIIERIDKIIIAENGRQLLREQY